MSTNRSWIDFDHAATSKPLAISLQELNASHQEIYGNPHSTHALGKAAADSLGRAQARIAAKFGVPSEHIIFTSGGTEANNLALWGALGGLTNAITWLKGASPEGQIITSMLEHTSVAAPFTALEGLGAKVVRLPVDAAGLIKQTALREALSVRTRYISIHHVQNEIGAVQDLAAIATIVHELQPNALIHVDAVQSYGKVPVSFSSGVDMLSISGHKFGAPKGIGALILGPRFEKRRPRILEPMLFGSEQQSGIRPGTVPVPMIAAFAAALEWSESHLEENAAKLRALSEHLIARLPKQAILHGPAKHRAPHVVAFSIPGLPSQMLVETLSARDICVSAGSACHSVNPKPNATLLACGASHKEALSMIRLSFGVENTITEVDAFLEALGAIMKEYL